MIVGSSKERNRKMLRGWARKAIDDGAARVGAELEFTPLTKYEAAHARTHLDVAGTRQGWRAPTKWTPCNPTQQSQSRTIRTGPRRRIDNDLTATNNSSP
jgi:hypothetical protein